MKAVVEIKPFAEEFHAMDNFREQIGVLYADGVSGDQVRMLRSWELVCQSGQAAFDAQHPGEDTLAGWQWIDGKIEDANVRGICHTHPSSFNEFSGQDMRSIVGLAKAHGKRYLWHVLHCVEEPEHARVICAHMPRPGSVLVYDFGFVPAKVGDSVLLLPTPPGVRPVGESTLIFNLVTNE